MRDLSADPVLRSGALDPRRPLERETDTRVVPGFTFSAVGDCIISRPLSPRLSDPGFARVMGVVGGADLRYGNLETTILDLDRFAGSPYSWDADWTPASTPAVAADLARLGFHLMSRANNHALDWGLEGAWETSDHLDAAGIVHAGFGAHEGLARAPRYLELEAGRVGLVSFATSFRPTSEAIPYRGAAPGRGGLSALHVTAVNQVQGELFAALAGPDSAADDSIVRFGLRFERAAHAGTRHDFDAAEAVSILSSVRLAAQHSDFVVVAIHAHQAANEQEVGVAPLRPAGLVEELGRAAIDAGAAVVVVTGNHNVGGLVLHRGRPIFTGLGNFFWSDMQEPLSSELRDVPQYRSDAARVFERPERVTDADLTAMVNAEGGFANEFTFQSIVPVCTFTGDGRVSELRLYPVELGYGEPLTRSGIPRPAGEKGARAILDQVAAFSRDVVIDLFDDDGWTCGRVRLDDGDTRPGDRMPS